MHNDGENVYIIAIESVK